MVVRPLLLRFSFKVKEVSDHSSAAEKYYVADPFNLAIEAARYPMTESREEWANDIMAFDQLLVEGFVAKALGALAVGKGATLEPTWQSLRILQAYLEVAGLSTDEARNILAPLKTLHTLRSQVKGHGAPDKKSEAVSAARTDHGTLRAHFTGMAGKCDHSTTRICQLLGIDLT